MESPEGLRVRFRVGVAARVFSVMTVSAVEVDVSVDAVVVDADKSSAVEKTDDRLDVDKTAWGVSE
jgi:hypothetical protein